MFTRIRNLFDNLTGFDTLGRDFEKITNILNIVMAMNYAYQHAINQDDEFFDKLFETIKSKEDDLPIKETLPMSSGKIYRFLIEKASSFPNQIYEGQDEKYENIIYTNIENEVVEFFGDLRNVVLHTKEDDLEWLYIIRIYKDGAIDRELFIKKK